MKDIWSKISKSILLDTGIILLVFLGINFILILFNIQFRLSVYYGMALLIVIGIVLGCIQIFIKKNIVSKFIIGSIILVILGIAICFGQIILFGLALLYKPEHIIEKDGKKYVAYVNSFLNVDVYYYDYINPLMTGNKIRIRENYGSGGYDPFDGKHNNSTPVRYYYYDDQMKVIKTNDDFYIKNYNQTNTTVYLNDGGYIELSTYSNVTTNDTPKSYIVNEEYNCKYDDVLYEKKIDDNIIIRVVYKGNTLGQKSIIIIEKTVDGGKIWNSQIQTSDGAMEIHNGTKIVFIDENIGFINDPGLAGTFGENQALLVTTDGGKHFDKASIKLNNSNSDIFIDDLPYVENGILKLKVYIVKNSENIYYNLHSKDNGKTWTQG